MSLTSEQKSAVRESIAAQQSTQIDASTARQVLEEKIAARAYTLFTETPRKSRQAFSHYIEAAARELTPADAPTEPKKERKAPPTPAPAQS